MPSVNGLPSVTEILSAVGLTESYGFLPAEKREEVMARGRAVHRTIELYLLGRLDEASVHPVVAPFFDGFRRFWDDARLTMVWTEHEFLHPWGFCGHIDLVAQNPAAAGCVLLDYKSGGAPDLAGAKYQLAGYRLGYDASTVFSAKVETCRVLHLPGDGSYKLIDVTDDHAVQVFSAAFIVYSERRRNGR